MPQSRICSRCARLVPATARGLCPACSRRKDAERMQAEPWRAVYSTRAWRTVREAARRRAGDRCQWMSDGVRCPVVHDVEVHHREPLREGSDPFDQWGLVVLCHEHHAAAERLG